MDKVLSILTGILFGGGVWLLTKLFLEILAALTGVARDTSWVGSLQALGGCLGTAGGIIVLTVFTLAAYVGQEYLNYLMGYAFVKGLGASKTSAADIVAKIQGLPISRGLKERMKRVALKQGTNSR